MKSPFSTELIDLLRKKFALWKQELQPLYLDVRFSVGEYEHNEHQFFSINFTALFTCHSESPDIVEFVVVLSERDAPVLKSADIIWGDGDGQVDLYFAEEELLLGPEVIAEFVRTLPQFRNGILECVDRRRPSDTPPREGLRK